MSITKIYKGYSDTRSGQVHYRTHGSGRALVLLHQTASSSAMYDALMPRRSRSTETEGVR